MVDTYCGSGLFGITLSAEFERVAGVEISHDSIVAAKRNAEMNGLGEKTEWLCGKAEDIFGGLPEKGFEGGKSCVVVDVSGLSVSNPFSVDVSYRTSRPKVVHINHTLAQDLIIPAFWTYSPHTAHPLTIPIIPNTQRTKLTQISLHEKDATPHSLPNSSLSNH